MIELNIERSGSGDVSGTLLEDSSLSIYDPDHHHYTDDDDVDHHDHTDNDDVNHHHHNDDDDVYHHPDMIFVTRSTSSPIVKSLSLG